MRVTHDVDARLIDMRSTIVCEVETGIGSVSLTIEVTPMTKKSNNTNNSCQTLTKKRKKLWRLIKTLIRIAEITVKLLYVVYKLLDKLKQLGFLK